MSTLSPYRTGTAALRGIDLPGGPISAHRKDACYGTNSEELQTINLEQWLIGRIVNITPQSTETATTPGGNPVPSDLPPEHLAFARHVGQESVFLRFSDGREATIDLERLGIDTSRLRLNTRASSWGSAVETRDRLGKTVHIDSALLRSYCDPKYAAELRQAIADATGR